jgi:hypothetical protein
VNFQYFEELSLIIIRIRKKLKFGSVIRHPGAMFRNNVYQIFMASGLKPLEVIAMAKF